MALCDVYAQSIDKMRDLVPSAPSFKHHEEMLAGVKDMDAVLIATPDHWHAGIAIDALNAGKDVYVEKPLTRTIEEGPAIIRAARVNERICQVGMQQRSGAHYWQAKEKYVDSGRLGKITLVRTVWHSGGGPRDRKPSWWGMPQPSNLDWARFLGPVRWREWDPHQYFSFRHFLDFGGGKLTDFFAHWGDVVHMFMDEDGPVSAVAEGGIYYYDDGRDAPDTINVVWRYPGGFTVTFESATGSRLDPYGIHFCGTGGRLFIDRNKYIFYPDEKGASEEMYETPENIVRAHVENFLECCRTRQRPKGDVYHGHRGAMAAHLGVMSYVEKRRIDFDPDRELVLPA